LAPPILTHHDVNPSAVTLKTPLPNASGLASHRTHPMRLDPILGRARVRAFHALLGIPPLAKLL
jgi:hypothetical protein